MLDTQLQPVTILYKGTPAGPGGPSEGKEATQLCPLGDSWPSTPHYSGCQDKMSTPNTGETPAPRNKHLNLLHKLGHGVFWEGAWRSPGHTEQPLYDSARALLSSGLPSPRRTSFWEDPGQITSLGEGPGFLP